MADTETTTYLDPHVGYLGKPVDWNNPVTFIKLGEEFGHYQTSKLGDKILRHLKKAAKMSEEERKNHFLKLDWEMAAKIKVKEYKQETSEAFMQDFMFLFDCYAEGLVMERFTTRRYHYDYIPYMSSTAPEGVKIPTVKMPVDLPAYQWATAFLSPFGLKVVIEDHGAMSKMAIVAK